MKNVVFISPNFPPNYRWFCQKLRDEGARVLAIGDSPAHALNPVLRHCLHSYVQVPNLADKEDMASAIHHFQSQFGPIHRIDSHNETWLPIEAWLRDVFDIPGQRPEDLYTNRTKLGMKARFIESGIPCAAGEAFTSLEQVSKFGEQHGYPLILKPDIGVGAGGTFKVNDRSELAAYLSEIDEPYLVEPYVRGEVVSYDGLVDASGTILFETAHLNRAGVMELRQSQEQTWYYSLRELPQELKNLGRRVVEAFGIRERFFHIEFFWLPQERFVALEVNVRPPGGFSMDMMNYACDIDLYRVWAQMILGQRVEVDYQRKYYSAHICRRWGLDYVNNHPDVLAYLGRDCCVSQDVPRVFAEAMGDFMYLVRTPDLQTLKKHIGFIQQVR